MAVVDFRSGGFVGAQPRQVRDYPYGQEPDQDESNAAWQQGHWDEDRYHTDADIGLTQDGSVIGRVGRLTHYLGAVVSVGLMVMLAVWGYKLVVRDVSGVPVIRAVQGDARSTPEDPGGELTERTGLAVNAVAGGAEPAATNQVALAPEATGLGTEDVPMGDLGASARQPTNEIDLPALAAQERVIALSDAQAAARAAAEAEAAELAAAETVNAVPATDTPVNEAVTDLDGQAAEPDAINAALLEATPAPAPAADAIQTSSRPAPRPRRVAAVQAAPAPAAAQQTTTQAAAPAARPEAAPAPAQKVAPSAISSGASMVQIGAFDSNALAEGEWNRVSGKFGALFSGKAQVVQKVETNGRNFWRLRAAGFESRDEARRFCAALIAEGIDCIPATSK